jgi:hypothetical protein
MNLREGSLGHLVRLSYLKMAGHYRFYPSKHILRLYCGTLELARSVGEIDGWNGV